MPHKHKRRQTDAVTFDLPPTMVAKSLPARDPNAKPYKKGQGKGNGKRKITGKDALINTQTRNDYGRKATTGADDTPKAFLRLMQRQAQGPRGTSKPDDGESKKRKRDTSDKGNGASGARKKKAAAAPAAAAAAPAAELETKADAKSAPKILPGERLSDFAARVDRELPISQMKRSDKPASADAPKIRETRVTKHEKHLRRLQEQWRKDDVEIREREAAEREEREEEMDKELNLWKEWELEAGKAKAKKKGAATKRKKNGQNNNDGDRADDNPDPWAKLSKRERAKKTNPFDVVQAPPQLTKPREIFKVRGGAKVDVANVPTAAGSLRAREELANERRSIVEQYRKLMAEKRQ